MEYKQCNRCVMDTDSGKSISFNADGTCNYCTDALELLNKKYSLSDMDDHFLSKMISEIKLYGKNKEFDCMMGMSGGIDSSYLLYLGNKWGLRILAIHVDDGFDSEITKNNIKKLTNACENLTLIIETPDEDQFCDLTRSHLLAGVPNLCAPQDNLLFASLYKYAKKYNIQYFLSGYNLSTESIQERNFIYYFTDAENIKDIHRKYGTMPIDKLSLMALKERDIYHRVFRKQTLNPLNYVEYTIETALKELNDFCGYESYGPKHHENLLTKFHQIYYLYNKCGSDTRKSHLSSLIVSNQLTRDEALKILEIPPFDSSNEEELAFVISKLKLTRNEFDKAMNAPSRMHEAFKTSNYVRIRMKCNKLFFLENKYNNDLEYFALLEEERRSKTEKLAAEFRLAFECVNKALLLEIMNRCHENDVGVYEIADAIKTVDLQNILYKSFLENTDFYEALPITDYASGYNKNVYKYYTKRIFQLLNSVNRSVQAARILFISKIDKNENSQYNKLINDLNSLAAIVLVYDGSSEELGDNDDLFYKIENLSAEVLEFIDIVVILDEGIEVDYEFLCQKANLVLDTRNVLASIKHRYNIETL